MCYFNLLKKRMFRSLLTLSLAASCYANEVSSSVVVVTPPNPGSGAGNVADLPIEYMDLEIIEMTSDVIKLRFESTVGKVYHVAVTSDLTSWDMEGFSMTVEGGDSVYHESYEANFAAESDLSVITITSDSGSLPKTLFFRSRFLGLGR